ncbi:ATP-dependent RNA helicase DeaD, partial [Reticulomyxa filosa]
MCKVFVQKDKNSIKKTGNTKDTKYHQAILCVKGSNPIDYDIDSIRQTKPSIIIGTPKRLRELFLKKVLSVESINYLVFDECDAMFSTVDSKQSLVQAKRKSTLTHSHVPPAKVLLQGIIKQRHDDSFNDNANAAPIIGDADNKLAHVGNSIEDLTKQLTPQRNHNSLHVMFVGTTISKTLKSSFKQL